MSVIVACLLVLMVPTLAVVGRAYTSDRLLVPASLFALIAGMLLEYRRIAKKWTTVLWTALGAFAVSFVAFLPGKREHNYNIETHIQMWPYAFCAFFLLAAIAAHKEHVTVRLHEGMTLLQTLALTYWCIDAGALEVRTPFSISALVLLGGVCVYALLHAFLPWSLSRRTRLWLSFWSSCIMLFLAGDNIRHVYGLGYVETTGDWTAIILIIGNYFLLGVSSIYMAQNAAMLFGFLPGKSEARKAYRKRIAELKDDHDKRYSDEQAPFGVALLCLVFAGAVFGLNMHWQVVRSNFAIWAVFLTFPWLLTLVGLFPTPSKREPA